MASYNRVMLMGNLTRDPEVRYTGTGSAVCALGLAVNRRYTTSSGESREETCFVDVDVWNRTAENCQKYLRKGAPVFVEGRLRMDEWEDRETGQRRSRLKVTADVVQFLSSPTRGEFDGGDAMDDGGGSDYEPGPPPAASRANRGGGGGYDRGGGGSRGGGYDRGGGGSRGGGGYDRGGGGYDRGGGRPSAPGRSNAPSQPPPPPFPKDDGPVAPRNDDFASGDDEPIDDIPF